MKALTLDLSFFTAHFKRHETKKFRSTYLSPPPTAVWGMLAAMFGVRRSETEAFIRREGVLVGAELRRFSSVIIEAATLLKPSEQTLKVGDTAPQGVSAQGQRSRDRHSRKLLERTVETIELLVDPEYSVAVAGSDEFVSRLLEIVEGRSLEFDVYAGITDCFLKDLRVLERDLKVEESTKVRGMVPCGVVSGIEPGPGRNRVLRALCYNEEFYQGMNVLFLTRRPLRTVGGIAVWGYEDVEAFRRRTP